MDGNQPSLAPTVILVFSGKRKSGKDYVTEHLKSVLGSETCDIMRLSAPLKKRYAQEHSLDYERLLDASDYKEKVRVDMIAWGEDRRNQDPGFFCRLATLDSPGRDKPIWIISDARRQTDLAYFKETYPQATLFVRVTASLETRASRGYIFTPNVDDAESECDLDTGVCFDIFIHNDGDQEKYNEDFQKLLSVVKQKLCPDPDGQ